MRYDEFLATAPKPIPFSQWVRFRFIERQLLWQREIRADTIASAFGVSKPQARRDLGDYEANGGEALSQERVDRSIVYRPGPEFVPQFIDQDDLLCDSFGGNSSTSSNFSMINADAARVRRRAPLEVVSRLQSAIDAGLCVEARYASLDNPKFRTRRLAPLSIVFMDRRFHVRAIDLDIPENPIKDFNISRFESITLTREHAPEVEDADWESFIKIRISPNPLLNDDQKRVIERDYVIPESPIEMRVALVKYFLGDNKLPQSQAEEEDASRFQLVAHVAGTDVPAYQFGF